MVIRTTEFPISREMNEYLWFNYSVEVLTTVRRNEQSVNVGNII